MKEQKLLFLITTTFGTFLKAGRKSWTENQDTTTELANQNGHAQPAVSCRIRLLS